MKAPKCIDELERIQALHRYGILDTPREEAFDDVTRVVSRLCETPIAVVNLIDNDRQWFKSEVGLGVRETPLDTSLCAHALLQSDLMIVPDTLLDPRFIDNDLVIGAPHLRFYAGVLLKTYDGFAIGTLCVLDYQPRTLTDLQIDALKVLAQQVMNQIELQRAVVDLGEIIDKQRVVEQELRQLHERESRIAETLQRSMLIVPDEGAIHGIAIRTMYEAALDESLVGGDFYDAFDMADGKVALVVGDVSGKGLNAAARTSEAKYALRAYLHQSADAADAMTKLNNFLCQTMKHEAGFAFIVLALVVIDTASGKASLCSAGSEPCLLVGENGGTRELSAVNHPLGILPECYTSHSFVLETGDKLVMFTDGLTEARRGNNFLGIDGLAEIAASSKASALVDFVTDLLEGAKSFAGGQLGDDACLLVARR